MSSTNKTIVHALSLMMAHNPRSALRLDWPEAMDFHGATRAAWWWVANLSGLPGPWQKQLAMQRYDANEYGVFNVDSGHMVFQMVPAKSKFSDFIRYFLAVFR